MDMNNVMIIYYSINLIMMKFMIMNYVILLFIMIGLSSAMGEEEV